MKKGISRRNFMRGVAAGAVGAAAASVLGGCSSTTSSTTTTTTAGDDSAKTFILSNVTTQCSIDAGHYLAELIEEKSDGQITIECYDQNILGDDSAATESTQIGDIHIVITATSPLVSSYPDYYIYDMPYLVLNRDDAMNVLLFSDLGKKIWQGVSEKAGLYGVSIWENGFRNLTNSKLEVTCVADCAGLKLRTMDNDVHLAAWQAFGANPSPMAFSELYTALQNGTMDGQENPFAIIVSNAFYEVQGYISMTEHVYSPHVVLMNPAAYDSMSDEQKAIFDECMDAATTKQFEYAIENEKKAVSDCEAGGAKVTELTEEAKNEFKQVIDDADIASMVKEKMDNPDYLDQIMAML